MPLKLGTWNMNLNGHQGTLSFDSVDAEGKVTGTINSDTFNLPVTGLWDNTSSTLSFSPNLVVVDDPAGPMAFPWKWFFKGVLFSTPFDPEPGQDIEWTLVGFFEVLDQQTLEKHRGNSRRNKFGWLAQIREVS
jgi:hypothetical protein